MSWWYVGFFAFGYCTGVYHLPTLVYDQIVDVPHMAHKMLLVCVFLVLTFFYCAFVFIPLERVVAEEKRSHNHSAFYAHNSYKPSDEDVDETILDRLQHVFLRRRGSF